MINKKNIEDILTLLPMQKGMLFHYLKDPKSENYFEQLSLEISGEIDTQLFERAWNVVIKANEMLRTVFRWEKVENPIQIVLKKYKLQWVYHDLSKIHGSETEKHLKEIKIKDREEQFDLRQVPFRVTLCKVEENKYEMIISNHHILYDGWSNGIILKEFFNSYNSLVKGNQLLEPTVKGKFKEFVKWNQNQDQNKQQKFWENYFEGFDTQIGLPVKRMAREPTVPAFTSYQLVLEKRLRDQLEIFIMENRVTLSAFFYCAWAIVLQKYCGIDDVVFGTTVSGRSAPIKGIEDMVGLFINSLPLRVKTVPGEKVLDLLLKINKSLPYREPYESTPLVDIKAHRGLGGGEELFDSIMIIENYPLDSRLMLENSEIFVDSYSMIEGTHYDLTIGIGIFDSLELRFTFSKDLFDEGTIVRLTNHFKCTIEMIIKQPEEEVSRLEIISEEEKSQILYEFNDTIKDYPVNKSIHVLFEEQSGRTPDRTAVVGNHQTAEKHERGAAHITYRELKQKSGQLAYVLMEKGVKPDTIVGMMIARSLEMIIGIIGVLKAGGAYLPLDPDYPEERIDFMLKDSNAKVLVITRSLSQKITLEKNTVCLEDYKELPPNPRYPAGSNKHRAASLAYIIYTSGTTGNPKAVMIRHQSVINLVLGLRGRVYDFNGEAPVNVSLISPYVFDASVKQIFPSLLLGHTLIIVPEEARVNGMTLLELYKKKDIQVSDGTPIHLGIILNCERELGNRFPVRKFVIGGDELGLHLVRRVNEIIDLSRDDFDLVNVYGPTECCDVTTSYHVTGETIKACQRIPIGTPLANVRVYIVGNHRGLQGVGVPGELCIAGDGLAMGYLNRVGETAEKFILNPFIQGEHLYCSGDLARWLPDGNIEFLGRKDYQVKIRGYRIEPGEIENRLLTHEAVNEAVVIPRELLSADKYLCAYIVLKNPGSINISALKKYLAVELPDYMVPSFFVELERIPLTANGKLNRKLLPEPEMGALTAHYAAPRHPLEKRLVEVWQEILEVDRIGIDDHFFQLGGHSLKAIILISRMNKAFHVNVPLAEIFTTPTIRGLSAYIKSENQGLFTPIEPAEKKDYHTLSSAQKRLYILHQMDEGSTSYNMPYALRLEGEVNKNKLEEIFLRLIARHESLRTSLRMLAEEPVQRIHHDVEFEIEYHDISEVEIKVEVEEEEQTTVEKRQTTENRPGTHLSSEFIRPFDLSHAPLLRVGLIKLEEKKYILMVDMHHIISDGVSRQLLIKEIMSLLGGEGLPLLRLQYRDFSQWQNSETQKEALITQENYWKGQLAGEIPVLDLPIDYNRPAMQQFEGHRVTFETDQEETRALNALAWERGTTLYMVLLAIYYIFLSKLSSQEDILVGTPSVGRRHADLEHIIGMFVNTLVLRNYPSGEKTYLEFLNEIKERSLEAFENQDYQYENLVEEVLAFRDASRNPMFDTMFVMQNMGIPRIEIPELRLILYEHQMETSKFDLTLMGMEVEEKLLLSFEYSTNLFKKATIEKFATYLKKIVSTVVANPDAKACDVEILGEEEKREIIYDFNNTTADYPRDKVLNQLFEEQIIKVADHIAVVSTGRGKGSHHPANGEQHISYGDLNRKANQLAYFLMEKRIKSDFIIGIMEERSLEMIVGILAILKTGGVYLPIDPDFPLERKTFMLDDSNAQVLLTSSFLMEGSRFKFKGEIFPLDDMGLYSDSGKDVGGSITPESVNKAGKPAYIMYTSGSTGRPKGVLVEHRNVVRLVINTNYVELTPETRILQTGAPVFDATTFEIWGALLNGGQLVLVEKGDILDAHRLGQALMRNKINTLWLTSSLFNQLVGENCQIFSILDYLLVGGDVLSPEFINLVRNKNRAFKIINGYGPTENTTFSTTFLIDKNFDQAIPIGRPINNSTAFILDRYRRLQPIGIFGELWVGGDGVSKGYLNNPELTAEKFGRVVNGHSSLVIGNLERTVNSHLSLVISTSKKHSKATNDRLYRTGDIVRWLQDGNIEFSGRVDHQVKIRGFRVECGEIERQLLQHPGINESVVLARENNGDRFLCAYVVSDERIGVSELKDFLSNQLPGYMIPDYFVWLDKFPLTPNGKIDRKALPVPVLEPGDRYVAPSSQIEKKLVEIWSEVLGTVAHASVSIGIDDNFFQLGGHSLKAAILISKIHKKFNVRLPLAKIFLIPTIRELAHTIKKTAKGGYSAIEPIEKREYYKLSSAQLRVYFFHHRDQEGTGYNMLWPVLLEGTLVKEALEKAFRGLTHRHESLRTSFPIVNNDPVQRIHTEVPFVIDYYDRAAGVNTHQQGEAEILKNFVKPFDLNRAPLLRVGLIKLDEKRHLLVADMHHIVADGTSCMVLQGDFFRLYNGEKLPRLRIQYKDFSCWQNRLYTSERIKEQENYWLNIYAIPDDIPELELPTDYPRQDRITYNGDRCEFQLGTKETAQINKLCFDTGTTLYMNLLALFNILLYKYSGQSDIIVGTGIMGRQHAELHHIIGMFVNMLAIRNFPKGEKTYRKFLEEVKVNSLDAFENQDMQFETLVDKLKLKRRPSRSPLFDVAFTVSNFAKPTPATGENPGEITLTPYEYEKINSRYDLVLDADEIGDKIYLNLKYKTDLFKKTTVEKMGQRYLDILKQVLENRHIKLEKIAVDYDLLNLKSDILQGDQDDFDF